MKIKQILTIVCLLALVGGMQAKDYKYQTVPGDLTKTRIYTLDNGLKVYLSVNKDKPRIQTYIAVRTGSKNDPAETPLRLPCWPTSNSATRPIASSPILRCAVRPIMALTLCRRLLPSILSPTSTTS